MTLRRFFLLAAFIALFGFDGARAQITPPPSGGSVCTLSGSSTSGYVLTATNGGTGCAWQTVGGASVDNNTLKNAAFIQDLSVSANTITGTTATTFPGAYAKGQAVIVQVANTVTGATTININTLGAKAVTKNGNTALAAGNLVAGNDYLMTYDGTEFEVLTFTVLAVDVPTLNQSTTGNAATATNLASYPALCSGGQFSQGLSSGSNNCGTPSGGGGSPGGTSGQVQFNNSGAFGGFTVSGDGTLNTSTGALAITKTAGVAFATSATTDTTNASNISSGTLAAGRVAVLNQNTTGTAANLSGTPTVPNGTAATTQSQNDNSTKLSTTAYTDIAVANGIAGVNPAIAVNAATTAAGDTSGLTYNNGVSGVGATFTGTANTAVTIDGFTFTAVGQRLLVKNDTQSPSGAFNGIYMLTTLQVSLVAPVFTRALDYDTPSDMNNTGAIPVINGTANGSTQWVLTSLVVTVGTTPLTFTQFSLNPSTVVTLTGTQTLTNKTVDGVTPTVFGYVDPTSSIQTQLNAKAPSSTAITGTPTNHGVAVGGTGQTTNFTAAGTFGQVLTSNGSSADPTYQAAPGGGVTLNAPVAFGSIPSCTSSTFFQPINNSLYTQAYCNGSSTLTYYYGGLQVTLPTGFAWQNQSTATLTTTNGGELLLSAVGANGANLNGREIAYPTAPFVRTLTARIKGYTISGHIAANSYGGIYISDGTKVVAFGLYGVGYNATPQINPSLAVQYGPTMTNITTAVSPGSQPIAQSDIIFIRFGDGYKCDGSTTSSGNRYYCYSYDNVNFIQFYTETNTTNLTATQMGYFVNGYDTSTYTMLWALGWQ